jgi:hypothetical protein
MINFFSAQITMKGFYKILITSFILQVAINSTAQTFSPFVINSIGTSLSGSGFSLDVNVGESIVGTINSANLKLTQGFLQPSEFFLDLRVFLEGYYTGAGSMNSVIFNETGMSNSAGITDTVTIDLYDANDLSKIAESSNALLYNNGFASVHFIKISEGHSYWIALNHRNTIQTWSANPEIFYLQNDFDFSIAGKTFGDNSIDVFNENIRSLYTGDLNQDGFIDIFDYPIYELDNLNFVRVPVYSPSDMNGDGYVDIFDFPVFDLNNQNFVSSIRP